MCRIKLQRKLYNLQRAICGHHIHGVCGKMRHDKGIAPVIRLLPRDSERVLPCMLCDERQNSLKLYTFLMMTAHTGRRDPLPFPAQATGLENYNLEALVSPAALPQTHEHLVRRAKLLNSHVLYFAMASVLLRLELFPLHPASRRSPFLHHSV